MSIEQVNRQRHLSRVASTTLACWYLLLAVLLLGTISVILTRPGWEVRNSSGWGSGIVVLAAAVIGLIAIGAGYTFGSSRLAKFLTKAEDPEGLRSFSLGTHYAVVGLLAAAIVVVVGVVVLVALWLPTSKSVN